MIEYLQKTGWYWSLGSCRNFKYSVRTLRFSKSNTKPKDVIIRIGDNLELAFTDWKIKYENYN